MQTLRIRWIDSVCVLNTEFGLAMVKSGSVVFARVEIFIIGSRLLVSSEYETTSVASHEFRNARFDRLADDFSLSLLRGGSHTHLPTESGPPFGNTR
jgi:hypothetical protein